MRTLSWNTLRMPLILSVCWCLLIGGLFKRALDVKDAHACELALIQTRTLYGQIVDTRAWNAGHGGVYVRESAYGAPNPWIPEEQRTMEGRDGTRLVLINPAYMSRQIGERTLAHGASFRITSLDPLRPENRADLWETGALRRCMEGASEVFSLEHGAEGAQYRFMAPLRTEENCLSCHRNNREGDLRGGISVSLSAGPFLAAMGENTRSLAFAYVLMGLTGVVGIGGSTLAVNRRRALAEEASRMKSAFLANMSHDMRTPLTGIMGMSEILADCRDAEEQIRARRYLREAAGALLEMVTDLTDHAVLDAGRMRLLPRSFEVRRTLARCLELFYPICASKGLSLDVEVDPEVPEWLHGDDFRLRQALGNLVGNAAKFTKYGGVRVCATVSAPESGAADRALLRCAVRDTGPGVPPEERENIFERFERGGAEQRSEGTGLGLVIAREIARRMGGDVSLENAPGAGACFVLSVLLGRADAPATKAAPSGNVPLPIGNARVLLAEDNSISAYFLKHVLSGAGYRVSTAADGLAVLRSLRRQPVDILLLDLRMPGLDGLEVARRIRGGNAGVPADLPVVALTASLYEDEQRSLEGLDISERLLKPIRPETLLRSVARALRSFGLDAGEADEIDPAARSSEAATEGKATRPIVEAPGAVRFSERSEAPGKNDLVFDRAAALDGLDGEEGLLRRLCGVFAQELPMQLRALRAAEHDGELRRLAHAVKNSAATLRLNGLRTAGERLERAAVRGADAAEKALLLKELETAAERALEALGDGLEGNNGAHSDC